MKTAGFFFAMALTLAVTGMPAYAESAGSDSFAAGQEKLERRDYAGAIADFSDIIGREKKNALAYHGRGLAKLKAGDRPGAIADFMRVIDLEPQLAADCLGKERDDAGKDEEDQAGSDRIQRIFFSDLVPAYAFAFDNRGLLKYIQGNYNGAIEDFSAAIALEPKFALPYKHRGYAKNDLQDFQGAIEDYSKAIKFDRKAAETYRERALAKEQAGDAEGAVEDLKKAAKLGDETARNMLAAKEEAEAPTE